MEAVNQVGSFFYGSLLGVFLLAFFVKRSNGHGAFWGLIAGMVAVAIVSVTTDLAWLYYNVVGTAATMIIGIVVSGLTKGPGDAQAPA